MTLQVGSTGDDVKDLQSELSKGGYYTGTIDGTYGPDTQAAVSAYQGAHGLTVDGIAGAETWGNIHGDAKYPNNSTGAMGKNASPDSGLGGPIDDKIKSEYPSLSWVLDPSSGDPEVAQILRDAYTSDPPWSSTLIQGKIMGTAWWKQNSDTARLYYEQQYTDPSSFQNKIRDYSAQIQDIGGKIGYDESILTPSYISYFANKAYRDGLNPAQIQHILADEITPLAGTTDKSPILSQMKQVQQQYQIAIDGLTQQYWLQAIGSGRQTIDSFTNAVTSQAKAQFPNLTGQFDSGLTFKQIIDPYRNQAAKLLEVNPEQLDFMGDAKWRHVVDYVDPKTAVHRTMSSVELDNYIKSMPEWSNTKNAVDQYSQVGQQIAQDFGKV